MILVPLERVDVELCQPPRVPEQEATRPEHPIQKEGIGPIDDSHIDLAAGKEPLEVLHDCSKRRKGRWHDVELDAKVDIAVRVLSTRDGRSELQEQPDAMSAGGLCDESGIHERDDLEVIIGRAPATAVRMFADALGVLAVGPGPYGA